MSTDVTAVAVFDASGAVLASGPGAATDTAAEVVDLLWDAASRRAAENGEGGLEHVVVPTSGGVVAVVEACGHRAVAVTGPRPAVALLLFDLRTCLGDAFAGADGDAVRARNVALVAAAAGAVACFVWWRRGSSAPPEAQVQLGLLDGAVRVLDPADPSTTELETLAARVRDSLTGGA